MKKHIATITDDYLIPLRKEITLVLQTHPRLTCIRLYHHFAKDSLYRNSIYMMLSTGIMSVLGFLFWLINARVYSTEQIGLATSLISVTTLITSFSMLGLNGGLIRYFSAYKDKNILINTVFTIVGVVTCILTIIYLLFLPTFSPKLIFITQNVLFSLFFILFTSLSAVNAVSDSVFVAYRSAKYIMLYNAAYSVSKLLLPVFLVSFGAIGIFFSYSFGIIICLLLTIYFLMRHFRYTLAFSLNTQVIKTIGGFSLANYLTTFIGGLPSILFPLIILNKLGPKSSAYYYMDMMIIGLLYMIPIAISQSLFAESSHDERKLKEHIMKGIRINLLLLLPAIVLVIFFGKYILLFFGKSYSTEGVGYLQLMSVSAILVPITYIFSVYFRIINKITFINIIATITAVITLYMSTKFISFGLYGIGIALIIGQLFQTFAYTLYVVVRHVNRTNEHSSKITP